VSGVVAGNRRPDRSLAIRGSVTLETIVPAWVAVTVVVFVGGSSSLRGFADVAKPARWFVLLVLDVLALALARDRLRPLRLGAVGWTVTGFVMLGLLSTAWSVVPRLSVERSISIGELLLAAGALAAAARGRPDRARRLIVGLAAGAGLVAVAGWLLLPFDALAAAQAAGSDTPWRFQGLGENPNTVAMLAALASPLVVWLTRATRSPLGRATWAIVLVAFAATIALSGSRGAALAGLAGVLVVASQLGSAARFRLAAAAATVVAFAAVVAVSQIPQPKAESGVAAPAAPAAHGHSGGAGGTPAAPGPTQTPTPPPARGSLGATYGAQLGDELQPTKSNRRQLFGSSGRVQAWLWALGEARKRPIVGYGFGTEGSVFIDRLYSFYSSFPENSFIGITLQLGAVGLLMLCALVVLIATSAVAAIRSFAFGSNERGLTAACAGVALAGLVIAIVQSYLYSAGNLSTLTVWTCAFLVADAARTWSVTS
jgi:O-antigen ligase